MFRPDHILHGFGNAPGYCKAPARRRAFIQVFQLLNGYAEGIDVQLIGQSVIDTIWGDIVCDVYYLEAEYETYYYVGASDGVNYLTEYTVGEDLYSVYLEGSSTVF